jgi:hypothetical protein
MKDAPEFGGDFVVDEERLDRVWVKIATDLGFENTAPLKEPFVMTWRDYRDYYVYQFRHAMLKPMSTALAGTALVLGGWIATVNASFASVPGDVLYPVKLVTERVQLAVTTSTQQRAQLHVEFATRRLQEVTKITQSSRENKDTLVKTAIEGFRQEIASVNAQLTEVRQTSPESAAAIAAIVDRKTSEYQQAFLDTASDTPETAKEDVAAAQEEAEQAGTQAVEALVESHEETQQETTSKSLKYSFRETYSELQTRITLSLGRLEVIEQVIPRTPTEAQPGYMARLVEARAAAATHDSTLSTSMQIMAAGGYRSAFDLLAEVEAAVSHSEAIITELEIDISTAAVTP